MPKNLNLFAFIAIAWAIFFTTVNAYGQELSYKQYSVKDGLPGSTVYQALQDRNGFIWFATNQGVSRFDGRTFVNYSKEDGLPGDDVIKLYLDRHNKVWAISLMGIPAVFHNDSIIRFENCRGVRAVSEDLMTDSIYLISQVEKNTDQDIFGVYRSANKPGEWKFPGSFRNSPHDRQILKISSPERINFYFFSEPKSAGILIKTDTQGIRYPITRESRHPYTAMSFFSLSPNRKKIAFYTSDSLYCADAHGQYPIASLKEHGLKEANFILYENDSTLWFCTRDRGPISEYGRQ